MASRKKRTTTKSKGRKTRATTPKKTVKRSATKRTKKSAKKRTVKTRRALISKRIQARQQKRGATPVVEETVIDVIDEPLPVRVTEIEETEVALPDTDDGKD